MTSVQSHDAGRRCVCVTEHRPRPDELHSHHVWPLSEGGTDETSEMLWLCPTMHVNVHELWRLFKRHEGRPPWPVLRYYSQYCRQVVQRGWDRAHPGPGAVSG